MIDSYSDIYIMTKTRIQITPLIVMATFQHFKLKQEQQLAVEDLCKGKDVLAILPTGFGKSVIFQAFYELEERRTQRLCCDSCNISFDEYYSRPVKQTRFSRPNGS